MKKIIITLFILLNSQITLAWEAKELAQELPVEGTNHMTYTLSSVQFKSSTGATVIYRPSVEPFSLADIKKYTFSKQEYFLTTWVSGASSVVLRVFRPDLSELPVCQESSDVEVAELRQNKDFIELSVSHRTGNKYKDTWAKCFKHTKDRKLNNVPKAKAQKAKASKKK